MNDGWKAAGAGAGGAAAGAVTWVAIGNMGLAALGTATSITAGPLIAIGAGLGLTGYGLYWLGKQMGAGAKNSQDSRHNL